MFQDLRNVALLISEVRNIFKSVVSNLLKEACLGRRARQRAVPRPRRASRRVRPCGLSKSRKLARCSETPFQNLRMSEFGMREHASISYLAVDGQLYDSEVLRQSFIVFGLNDSLILSLSLIRPQTYDASIASETVCGRAPNESSRTLTNADIRKVQGCQVEPERKVSDQKKLSANENPEKR